MSWASKNVWGSITKYKTCIKLSMPVPRRSVPGSRPWEKSQTGSELKNCTNMAWGSLSTALAHSRPVSGTCVNSDNSLPFPFIKEIFPALAKRTYWNLLWEEEEMGHRGGNGEQSPASLGGASSDPAPTEKRTYTLELAWICSQLATIAPLWATSQNLHFSYRPLNSAFLPWNSPFSCDWAPNMLCYFSALPGPACHSFLLSSFPAP